MKSGAVKKYAGLVGTFDLSNKPEYSNNRIISMLEGGYDIQALEQSMLIHLRELQKK